MALLLRRIACRQRKDAAYCYQLLRGICMSVCLSVGHDHEPYQND